MTLLSDFEVVEKQIEGTSDYYYSYSDFVQALAKKSSSYNYRYFIRHKNPYIQAIDGKNKKQCRDITKNFFCDVHHCKDCWYGCEMTVIEHILAYYQQLGVTGFIVYGEGEPLGFCIAEVFHHVLVVHFKKCIRGTRGLNEYIHKKLLEQFGQEEIQWINYTDDMNIKGLREYKSKLAPYQL